MLIWKELVQNQIIKHSDQILKTTQPLKEHFGASVFVYNRIQNDGKYMTLCDSPTFSELYVEKKMFLLDPYMREPKVYKSGMCLTEHQGSDEFKTEMVWFCNEVLQMGIDIVLIEKHENEVEIFNFIGPKTCFLQNVYTNHPELLRSFAHHFRQQQNELINRVWADDALSLPLLKGPDYYVEDPIYPEINIDLRLAFLKDLGMKNIIEKLESLSPRERACLKLLAQDKTAKETALLLNLSPRTIEAYFENIKNKFSCWNKYEILKIARDLESLGILT
ncbi:MAG: helix-turn-helix transcriptional regulator [Chlamydiales bacterium]|nr:helix-turn-helix transcriptional regulator [Chlamydiales bacterium]